MKNTTKISELVKRLQESQKKFGDVKVYLAREVGSGPNFEFFGVDEEVSELREVSTGESYAVLFLTEEVLNAA